MSSKQFPKKNRSPISIVILDFDGVILESVSLKTEAFRDLFAFSPGHVDDCVKFHSENGGMSRFEKFRYIYKNILKEELSEEKFNELSDRFSSLVYQKVLNAPFVPGVLEFLENAGRTVNLYVVSATPENELIQILKERQILHFFVSVHGSSEKKITHLNGIIRSKEVPLKSILFVGDSKNDYEAAHEAGIRFIARIKPGEPDYFGGLPGIEHTIKDLFELDNYVRK